MGKSFSRLGVGGGRYFTAITAAPKIGSTTATSAYISVTKKEGTFENCFFVCLSGRCTREGGSCLLEAPGGMAKDGLGLGPGSMWGAGGGRGGSLHHFLVEQEKTSGRQARRKGQRMRPHLVKGSEQSRRKVRNAMRLHS